MATSCIIPHPTRCHRAETTARHGCRTLGGQRRVHSRYHRRVLDLPWTGVGVRLDRAVRRFFCPTCGAGEG